MKVFAYAHDILNKAKDRTLITTAKYETTTRQTTK